MKKFLYLCLAGTAIVTVVEVAAQSITGYVDPSRYNSVSSASSSSAQPSTTRGDFTYSYWNWQYLSSEKHPVTFNGNTATVKDHVGNTVTVATKDSSGQWKWAGDSSVIPESKSANFMTELNSHAPTA